MADETQVSTLREGAAEGAPTAPHATPAGVGGGKLNRKRTGPERFWRRRTVNVALVVCTLLSFGVHMSASPWDLFPSSTLEIKDVAGELAISVDLLSDEPLAAPAPPPPTVAENAAAATPAPGAGRDAGPPVRDAAADHDAPDARPHDAGPRDAGQRDAGVDGGDHDDASALATLISDASVSSDGSAVASLDDAAVKGPGGGTDPSATMGAAGAVQAGKQNVWLLLNMVEVRKNPVGAALGPLITAIPQWNDFLAGSKVDPVQHTEWLLLNGPSLAHTERDAVIVRYSLDDIWVDAAIERIAKRSPDGRTVDAGVPGVKVTVGFGDRAKRAFVRPQPHLVAVVPPDYAAKAAALLKGKFNPRLTPGEAVSFRAHDPHGSITEIPAEVSELRIRVVLAANDGVDVLLEGDCADNAAATKAAGELEDWLRRTNALGVKLVTRGVLNHAEVRADESRVKIHVPVTREQLDALYSLAAGFLGVTVAPPPASSGAARPSAPP